MHYLQSELRRAMYVQVTIVLVLIAVAVWRIAEGEWSVGALFVIAAAIWNQG